MVPMIDAPARAIRMVGAPVRSARVSEGSARPERYAPGNKAVFLACMSQWQRVFDTADPRRSCGK